MGRREHITSQPLLVLLPLRARERERGGGESDACGQTSPLAPSSCTRASGPGSPPVDLMRGDDTPYASPKGLPPTYSYTSFSPHSPAVLLYPACPPPLPTTEEPPAAVRRAPATRALGLPGAAHSPTRRRRDARTRPCAVSRQPAFGWMPEWHNAAVDDADRPGAIRGRGIPCHWEASPSGGGMWRGRRRSRQRPCFYLAYATLPCQA